VSGPSPSPKGQSLLPSGWLELAPLLDAVLDAPPERRASLIRELSAGDPNRQHALTQLLAECERDVPLLDRGAAERFGDLASEEAESLLPELLADRYQVVRELGCGGMARVYLARDLKHGRDVAIKVLHAEFSALIGPERFLKEIELTAGLQHPHILPLFDSGASDGLLYYVMPYVDGETLRERLKREHQLPIADAVRIASAVADALDYAHKRGVIHRDIKPENILLHDGRALVADFGIALAVQSAGAQRMTQPGRSLGTPQYMSPEQSTGEHEITARSDIYALGVVTYEMLIGEPPFTGATVQQILARACTEEPRPISAQRKHVAPNVEAAALTALEKLPADRFGSAGEFARALSDPGFRGTALARSLAARTEHRGQRMLVASLGVVTIALAALAARGLSRKPDPTDGVVRLTLLLPRDVGIVPKSAVGATIAVSPDGKAVVFTGSADDGTSRLYARALDEVVPHMLTGSEGASQPFFSPDGRWIGFWSGGRLQKLPAEGGLPHALTTTPEFVGATWTRQNVIVYSDAGSLYSIPAAGGAPTLVSAPDSAAGETGQWYPIAMADGDHVLYTSGGRAGGGTGGREGVSIGLASLSARSGKSLGIPGTNALGVIDGRLIYTTRDNTLWAVPFDVSAGPAMATAAAVATNVSVTSLGSAKAALSLSGTLAYLTGGSESRIVLIDSRGGEEVVLPDRRAYAYPRFSPDGKRVAVSIEAETRSDVWIYHFASRTLARLSAGGAANERPEWTPDGTRVIYRTDAGGRSAIWWRPADLSGPAVSLLAGEQISFFEGVITPDGRAIVYQVERLGSPDIGVRALVGDTTPTDIAVSNRSETQARVSPNGRWIAFVTDESGSDQVVVQPFPGPGVRVQVSSRGGREPVWSPDGRRLFYRANKKFMTALITSIPTLAVVSRDVFGDDGFVTASAPHANYDVSPDGKRLLVLEAVEDEHLVIVHNWSSEVRARLRGRTAPR
jgi:Tol biopolymer transport system component